MNTKIAREWAENIDLFNRQNSGRPTRLGVFEPQNGVVNDYWIENGLPLIGLVLESHNDLPTVEISLEGLSRSVMNVVQFGIKLSSQGDEDGVDLVDSSGNTTMLRFNVESEAN